MPTRSRRPPTRRRRSLTAEQAARIDDVIRRRVPCRMRPCRVILADLEAVARARILELAAIARACRSPLEPATARVLAGAASVFAAERVGGVHVASVAVEAADVAEAIRIACRRMPPRSRAPRVNVGRL